MQKVFRYLEMFSRDGLRDRRTDILITNAAIHYIVRPKKKLWMACSTAESRCESRFWSTERHLR